MLCYAAYASKNIRGESYVTSSLSTMTVCNDINRSNGMIRSGPEAFPCSTQLSMDFFLLIDVKMPTTVGILTFMSRTNRIIGLSEPEKGLIS